MSLSIHIRDYGEIRSSHYAPGEKHRDAATTGGVTNGSGTAAAAPGTTYPATAAPLASDTV